MTPTQRTLTLYRNRGFVVGRVERWQPTGPGGRGGVRRDFLGLIDFIALKMGHPPIGIQSCGESFAKHIRTIESRRKMLELWLSSGSHFHLVGWDRRKPVPRTLQLAEPIPAYLRVADLVEPGVWPAGYCGLEFGS